VPIGTPRGQSLAIGAPGGATVANASEKHWNPYRAPASATSVRNPTLGIASSQARKDRPRSPPSPFGRKARGTPGPVADPHIAAQLAEGGVVLFEVDRDVPNGGRLF